LGHDRRSAAAAGTFQRLAPKCCFSLRREILFRRIRLPRPLLGLGAQCGKAFCGKGCGIFAEKRPYHKSLILIHIITATYSANVPHLIPQTFSANTTSQGGVCGISCVIKIAHFEPAKVVRFSPCFGHTSQGPNAQKRRRRRSVEGTPGRHFPSGLSELGLSAKPPDIQSGPCCGRPSQP
jgi:hypothetical protein